MNFSLEKSIEILERTPGILQMMLKGLSDDWILSNEGGETWSAYDVVGHLINADKTDWMPRLKIILSEKSDPTFEPFDRFAQFEESKGKSLTMLLDEFEAIRKGNILQLRSKHLAAIDFTKKGIHPEFGEVTLSQLISTWVVHDLNHIAQISRVMAWHYLADVGPWIEYLRILKQ